LIKDDLVAFLHSQNIAVQAYSPLTKGKKLKDSKLVDISKKYNVSTAQVLIRWSLQKGYVVIAKCCDEERIRENGDVFTFEINNDDMKRLDGFNENLITGWDVSSEQ